MIKKLNTTRCAFW